MNTKNSFEPFPQSEKIRVPERNHLKEGIRPIMACVGTYEQFGGHHAVEKLARDIDAGAGSAHNVDYYGNPEDLSRRGFKNKDRYLYVISPVDNLDKFSKSFRDCTGVVVTGLDKKTGKNISFLSHQDPQHFLKEENKNAFVHDLRQQLRAIRELSKEGTIDAIIVGGNYFNMEDSGEFADKYVASIAFLSKEIKEALGFEPLIKTGPKVVGGSDDILLDTKHRRLYVVRPEVGDVTTESFVTSDMKTFAQKWGEREVERSREMENEEKK